MAHLTIWTVDDDSLYQGMLIAYLAVLGYQSRGFASGEECLKYLSEKPDVILLDHNLGEGMNGVEVLRKIKSEHCGTRVIYISGAERISLVSDTYQNGSEEYITKDSATLLRLKLRLDKIVTLKNLHRRRWWKKIVLYLGGTLSLFILLFILYLTM